MPTRDELANALRKADAAGATDDAKRLADAIRAMDGQTNPAQPAGAPGALEPMGGASGEWDLSKFRALPPQPVAKPQQPYQPQPGAPFDPLAKNGVSTGRSLAADDPFSPAFQAPAPEAPKAWNEQAADFISRNVTPFGEALAGQRDNNEILKTVTGGLPEWTATAFRDPNLAQQEAGQFIRDTEPTNLLAGGYNDMQGALSSLIQGNTGEAFDKYKQATPKLLFGAAGMAPGGSFVGDAARAGARPRVGAVLRPGDARIPSATSIDSMPQAPAPEAAPPAQMFSAPPGPAPRKGNPIIRKADQIVGGTVGAALGGGAGEAFAAPGDGSGDEQGPPLGAIGGAAVGIFGPRALANASSRGFRAAARPFRGGASFDERVAAKAVRDVLKSSGIKSADQAAAEMAARYGDKPAAVADLAQEGVGTAAGLSRLPGKTGEAAKARSADLLENRSGRLFTDIESTTGIDPAGVTKSIDDAIRQASEEISPAYEQMFAAHQGVNSERLMQLMSDPVVAPYLRRAVQASESLATTAGQVPSNARTWDLVKRGLDRTIEGQIRTSGQAAPELMAARQAVRDELDGLIPQYKSIRDNADAPRMRAARKEGANAMGGRLSVEKVKKIASGLTGRPLTTMQAGMIEQLVPGIEKGHGVIGTTGIGALSSSRTEQALAAAFGEDIARNLVARVRADAALTQNASRINPNVGSVTSQAGMGGGGVGGMLAGAVRAVRNPTEAGLAWLSKSGAYSKQQRDIMGEMLLEGATPENLQRIFRGRGGPPQRPRSGPPGGRGGAAATTAAAGGAAGVAAAGSASADTGDSQAELASLSERITKLEADKSFFANASAVEIQERLRKEGFDLGKYGADGKIGADTAKAIQAYKQQIEDDLAQATGRRKELENEIAYDRTRPAPWAEGVREAAPWLAFAAGGIGGKMLRGSAVKSAEKKALQTTANANALLNKAPVKPAVGPAQERALHQRYSNINRFWSEGGAGKNVPFKTTTSGEWRGQKAPDPASLYPEGSKYMRTGDAAVMGTALAEGGAAQFIGVPAAQAELEKAQAAVDQDANEANLTRLENARNMLAIANTVARVGFGVAAGRGAGVLSKPYKPSRPNIQDAEAERAALLALSKRKPGGGPPVPPTAPPGARPPVGGGATPIRGATIDGGQTVSISKINGQDFNGTLYIDPTEGLSFHPNYPSDVWNDLGDALASKLGKNQSTLKRMITPESGAPGVMKMTTTRTEGPKWSEGNINQIGKESAPEIDEAVRNRFIGLVKSNPDAPKFSLELDPKITSKDTRKALLSLARDTDRVFVEVPDDTISLIDRNVYNQNRARYRHGNARFEDAGLPPIRSGPPKPPKTNAPSQGGALDLTPDGWERSAQVGKAKLTYAVHPDGTMSLEMIDVPKASRGQGEAGKALDALLAEADAKGLTVYLEPKPVGSGGMTRQQLEAFYRKRGFTQQAGTPGLTRSPN